MRIDRLSFFAALGACNAATSASGNGNAIEIPHQPPPPPDAGAHGPVALRTNDDAGSDEDHEDGECGFVDPRNVERPPERCSDDEVVSFDCSRLKGCGSSLETKCEGFKKYLKPRIGKRAFDCLAKLDKQGTCDACSSYRCGDRALKSACTDPSADGACLQITSKCKSVSMAECRLYVSGLETAGRVKLVSCLTTDLGCGYGIYSCTEGF